MPAKIAVIKVTVNCRHNNLTDTEVDAISEALDEISFLDIVRNKLDEAGFGPELEIEQSDE